MGKLNPFKKPSKPKLTQPEKIEEVENITEEESSVKRRTRRRLEGQGRIGNIFAGIGAALKKRLGE
ncbi:unnamed protein product [marine sediment metagenome]|uniref:Uncharacterized protein n=1 Tax=marine sediment metagenome TaxID=412755 RepID=X0XSI7_9ZZZZ